MRRHCHTLVSVYLFKILQPIFILRISLRCIWFLGCCVLFAVISQFLIHENYLSIFIRVVLMTQWWMQIYFYIFLNEKSSFHHIQCQNTKLLKAPQFIPIDQQVYNTSPCNPESKLWSTSDTWLDQLRTNHGIVPDWTLPILYQLLCWFQWITHR